MRFQGGGGAALTSFGSVLSGPGVGESAAAAQTILFLIFFFFFGAYFHCRSRRCCSGACSSSSSSVCVCVCGAPAWGHWTDKAEGRDKEKPKHL